MSVIPVTHNATGVMENHKIIAIAPSRISLFGGGTDTPYYAENFGGLCLNLAINIRHRVVLGDKNKLTEADNPRFIKAFTDFPVIHEYDNTIESGLGGSAGLAVILVAANARYKGEVLTLEQISEKAWDIEVNKIKLFGGRQDQYACAYGGVNVMEFTKDGVKVTPLSRESIEWLLPYMVLFYTGFTRKSPKIQEGLKVLSDEQVFHLTIVKNMAIQGITAMVEKDINKVANLMRQAWEAKKASNKGVSNEEIDKIHEEGLKRGALCGKLLGSGGGGHILYFVQPEQRNDFIKAMEEKGLKWVDFGVDWSGVETRMI